MVSYSHSEELKHLPMPNAFGTFDQHLLSTPSLKQASVLDQYLHTL